MGAFAAGNVILLRFPFSDLSGNKLRPALLLADVARNDWVACQITSNPYTDPRAITLDINDFADGGLRRISYARPGKLFTANETVMVSSCGSVKAPILKHVREAVITIISGR